MSQFHGSIVLDKSYHVLSWFSLSLFIGYELLIYSVTIRIRCGTIPIQGWVVWATDGT